MMKTKMKLLVVGTLLLSFWRLPAQNFSFGLLGGADWVTIDHDRGTDMNQFTYEPNMSYNVNGYLRYRGKRKIGVTLEPGYMVKGANVYFSGKKEGAINLSYLQLPFTFDFYATEKLHFSFGPEFSYLLTAEYEKSRVPFDSFYKDFETSFLLGVNYAVLNGLELGLRYNRGLTPVDTLELTDTEGNSNGVLNDYNTYFQVVARFRLDNIFNKLLFYNDK